MKRHNFLLHIFALPCLVIILSLFSHEKFNFIEMGGIIFVSMFLLNEVIGTWFDIKERLKFYENIRKNNFIRLIESDLNHTEKLYLEYRQELSLNKLKKEFINFKQKEKNLT